MPVVQGDIIVKQLDARTWELQRAVVYKGQKDLFIIPAGYLTDFASVPRALTWHIPPYGDYTVAAIVHDWLITDLLPTGKISSADVDGLFRRILRERGVSWARRWQMWAGVRFAAVLNPVRRSGWLSTLPLLLACTPLALPLVFGVVGVLLSTVLHGIVELCTGGTKGATWKT